MISMLRKPFAADRFAEYQRQSGLDALSVVGDPRFVNAGGGDFRLSQGSAAMMSGGSLDAAGSRKRLQTD